MADIVGRLLFQKPFREAWLAGHGCDLGLSEDHLRELETINREELARTCRKIVSNLISGDLGANGGLRRAYPRLFKMLGERQIDAHSMIEDFMCSPEFDAYREVHNDGPGLCVEEAFYIYLTTRPDCLECHPAMAALLEHEFLTALLSILVINREPAFRIDTPLIRDNGVCYFAARTIQADLVTYLGIERRCSGGEQVVTYLYAATRGRFISGPVSPIVPELIAFGSRNAAQLAGSDFVQRDGVIPVESDGLFDRMVQMGLIAP